VQSGTNGAVPVNGCFNYDHNSNQLSNCDGKMAADMFCREKHFGFAKTYQVCIRCLLLGATAYWRVVHFTRPSMP
jgi:hypothetical protein